MVKRAKILAQIEGLNAGLHWSKVEALLVKSGAEVIEGQGSRVTFVLDDRKFTMHRPHPRRECGRGLVKAVRDFLRECGRL